VRGVAQNDGAGGIAQVAVAATDDDAASAERALTDRRRAGVGVCLPLSARTPTPVFARLTVPEPFWITPENVLVWSLLPTVNVIAPATPEVIVPLPLRPLTMTL